MMAQELLTDIFSILILIILLISSQLSENVNGKVERRFSVIVLASLLYLISNSLGVISEGHSELSVMTFTSNLAAFVLVDCVFVAFCFYLGALLESTNSRNPKAVLVPIVTCVLRIVLVLVLAAAGNLFYVDAQGCYKEAALCFIPYYISGIVTIELLWIVIRNRRCFTTRQLVVILIYLIFHFVPVVLESYLDLYSLTGLSMTLALLLIYVLVQVAIIERGKMRESVLEEISYTDILTGLNNRRSYYRRLSELAADQSVGVIFCDLNLLKYTNDHFGHAAGDALIRKFADILSDYFRSDDIYRISGDEFIVIISDVSKDSFEGRLRVFRPVVERADHIASLGHSYGTGGSIDKLISEAEQIMYENKRKYHEAQESNQQAHGQH